MTVIMLIDIALAVMIYVSLIHYLHRALVNPDKLHMPMSNATEMNDKIRDLLTKQIYEAAKLESDLHAQECDDISRTINEFDNKKQAIARDLSTDLQKQLAKAKSPAVREKLSGNIIHMSRYYM